MNFDDYKNKLDYPQKKNFTTKFYYKAGEVVAKVGPNDPKPLACLNGCVTETVINEEAYRTALSEYSKMGLQLADNFVVDLLHDFGLPDNEFTRKLYAIAYEQGHSSGYSNIYSCFQDLEDLNALAKKVYGK